MHIYNLSEAQLAQPSLVTIGVFDGVHRGHQHLIQQLVQKARAASQQAVVLTFFPHPDVLLQNLEGRYYLTTPEQKAREMLKLGVDYVITQTFDESLRHIRAAAFVDTLIERLQMSALWVGADFAMGYQREGNVSFLQAQGAEKGFDLQVLDLLTNHDDAAISSTHIRQAIQAGEVEKARHWLGRGYSVTGEVTHGEQRGRKIGFPTANVDAWSEQVLPANGVYAGWATLGDEQFMAVTNIGVRPTFSGQGVTVEAHLLDFNRDIYGQQLEVSFETRLRPEKKFNGIQELIAQISLDAQTGREYLSSLSPANR
jgi:riboflavin kinase / FMN adenylyltransferase